MLCGGRSFAHGLVHAAAAVALAVVLLEPAQVAAVASPRHERVGVEVGARGDAASLAPGPMEQAKELLLRKEPLQAAVGGLAEKEKEPDYEYNGKKLDDHLQGAAAATIGKVVAFQILAFLPASICMCCLLTGGTQELRVKYKKRAEKKKAEKEAKKAEKDAKDGDKEAKDDKDKEKQGAGDAAGSAAAGSGL